MAKKGVGGGFIPHLGVVLYPRPPVAIQNADRQKLIVRNPLCLTLLIGRLRRFMCASAGMPSPPSGGGGVYAHAKGHSYTLYPQTFCGRRLGPFFGS